MTASYFRNERDDHTLQPTALVNEVYIRLGDQDSNNVVSRNHFFGVASRLMRQILVDHARTKRAGKRGGDWSRVTLSSVHGESSAREVDIVVLDEVLSWLEALNEGYARLVELRFFSGLTSVEAGEILGVSRTDLARRWRIIKAWLIDELRGRQNT